MFFPSRGNIRTTVEYIVKLMHNEDFISNVIDTAWLDERIAQRDIESPMQNLLDPLVVVIVGATIKASFPG